MKLSPWYLLAAIAVIVLLASGTVGAQLVVIGLTLGIFFGTVSLRKPAAGDATTTNPGHG